MEPERVYNNKTVSILLITASLVLLGNGVFSVYLFSIQYGVGAGALVQARAYNLSVVPLLQPAVNEINALYQTVLESYLLTGIGLIMFAMAFVLLIHSPNHFEAYKRRYVPAHIMLAFVYAVSILIIHSVISFTFYSTHLYITYVAVAICILFDAYLELGSRAPSASRIRGISINPATPYANLIRLREELFNSLQGEIGIVDKHFNSTAISNLYRLIPLDNSSIKSFKIITSSEMLDSNFGGNYRDLKNELKNKGIDVEVKIMNKDDATAQHERFIFDEVAAYKIPPLNIINKKSEHIFRMSIKDTRKRFEYLDHNSAKIENYSQSNQGQETA